MKKIFFLIVVLVSSSFALTKSDLDDIIRYKLKDTGPSSAEYHITDPELTTYENIIQRDICYRTDSLRRFFFIDASTDTAEYEIDEKILKIYGVYFEDTASTGTYTKLDYTSRKVLDKDNTNWENYSSGQPIEWYETFLSTSSSAKVSIGLSPAPSAAYTFTGSYTYRIRIDASCQAEDMSSDSDIPFNGDTRMYPLHKAIIYGVIGLINDDGVSESKYRDLIGVEMLKEKEKPDREGGIRPRMR